MKTLFLLFFLLPMYVWSQTQFENVYGRGILEINTTKEYSTFEFYKTPGDTNPIIQIEFRNYFDSLKHCRDYSYEKLVGDDSIFVPELLHRSESCVPFQLNIAYVQEKNGFYQVIMNVSMKRKLVWLKKSDLIIKLTFEEFYKSMCTIEIFEGPIPQAWKEPSKKSTIVFDKSICRNSDENENYSMRCLAIKGYWMQVEIVSKDPSIKNVSGWILWRNDKENFMGYNLLCC